MNAFAKAACSSIPVATARMFGSRMTSSGANPASVVTRSYARPRISTLRSTVSACPRSSKAMTTTAAPNRRIVRACSRNGSSPSFSEIELTTPLPCRQRRPASSAEKRELSTMIGSRAASGSVARRLRNVVIACSASSRSASMFTSSRFAPPRTCSSATSTAPWKSFASIRRRKRADPVTFVRSPTTTNPVSGPITNGSRPEKRGLVSRAGTCRGGSPSTARAIACVCSGVVPQQPPTRLTRPSSANARR